MNLYEILIPTIKDGKPVTTRYHRVWDAKVRSITGGLTILKPAIGNWIDKENKLYIERMIPVRVMCTLEQINTIVDFSAKYYNQKAIMYYELSNKCYIRNFE